MDTTIAIDPNKEPTKKVHQTLLGAIGPRPIAFASTIDEQDRPNLSPYSFFNVFSANPPILIFSPARRVRDNTTKHTLENCKKVKEVVVNIVNYDIVQQMSLSSTEYEEGVNEFEKSGLTMIPSEKIKPFRVGESPVQFECLVKEIIALGNEGGAGNLIICEVVMMHVNASLLSPTGEINQQKIDQVARMGGNWYTRAKEGMFEVPKPLTTKGIGIDQLPENIKNSEVLTGNDLGMLGNVASLPSKEEILNFVDKNPDVIHKTSRLNTSEIHKFAQSFLICNEVEKALLLLMINQTEK
ncbi:flavin reductase family protein [Aquimarina sp. ERC-38]|uniref:flavin reductase family protein n=1 Tax=Aquimarina sp. ERC-38 TaxID=2949996 RepID=UPI002247A744|nr:flavin reductase family protein [Aquimarina sp. ERC-38]UZO81613.1 flavin reductase family protein [Aquimarina sp. ERC-38]